MPLPLKPGETPDAREHYSEEIFEAGDAKGK
jgi:hypothetical protein